MYGALQVVILFPVDQSAQQQCAADQSVEGNHQHRMHRIACQNWGGFARQHDGGNQRYFNTDHRQREDQRSVWLSQGLCKCVGVTYYPERTL